MIAPGWMPSRPRPRPLKKIARRTCTYTRARRRVVARTTAPVNHEVMLFDVPRELPVVTVRRAPTSIGARLAGAFAGWLEARWAWLRPRSIPVLVAALGMIAVINAVNYLGRAHAVSAQVSLSDAPSLPDQNVGHISVVLHE